MIGVAGLPLFILLLFGHCLADYPLQTDKLAVGKCPGSSVAGVHWTYWLAGHAGTHAFVVALLTNNIWLGCAEFVIHSIIDICKCKGCFNLAVDQFLHVACKAAWVLILGAITVTA